MRDLQVLIVVWVLGYNLGCIWPRKLPLLTSVSPNEAERITINERVHGADASLEIEFLKNGSVTQIYADRADRVPGLAEVYWSPDTKTIGVLVCDPATTERHVIVGYDSMLGRNKPADTVTEPLRKSLTARYSISASTLSNFENDPISWACSQFSGARERFAREVGSARILPPLLAGYTLRSR